MRVSRFLGVFLFLMVLEPTAAQATHQCGSALVSKAGTEQNLVPALLDHFGKSGGLIGTLRIVPMENDDPTRIVVFYRGEVPRTIRRQLTAGGNESHRLFSSRTLVFDKQTAFWNWLRDRLASGLGYASLGVLTHELINPGVLPNSLPMIPALSVAWAGPKILANLASLRHRYSSPAPTAETLASDLASYLTSFQPRKTWVSWLPRFSTQKTPYVLHLIDLAAMGELVDEDHSQEFLDKMQRRLDASLSVLKVERLIRLDSLLQEGVTR